MEIRFELVKFSRKKLNVEKVVVARKVLVSKDGMEMQNCLLLFLRKLPPLDIRP